MAKGKCSFHTKLTAPAEAVAFAPSGAAYALICGSTVSLHATEGDGSMLQSLQHERKVLCIAYHGESIILTGAPIHPAVNHPLRTYMHIRIHRIM